MFNLKAYKGDSFDFLKEVVDRKKITNGDPTYKDRLVQLYAELQTLFKYYDKHFDKNTLEKLKSFGYKNGKKEDLENLYSYKSRILQDLKITLTTTISNRVISTCQNCSIGEVNSFDHILPQGEFPEFIINPKNLFPSCSKCNSHKSKVWKSKTGKVFLNLYIDKLPEKQYLFVNVLFEKGTIKTSYYLNNKKSSIEPSFFKLLESHYDSLHLFQRFRENSDAVVMELINSIKPYVGTVSKLMLIKTVKEKIKRNQGSFGFNNWKSVLESELIGNKEFQELLGL
jgi:hypothetical protein